MDEAGQEGDGGDGGGRWNARRCAPLCSASWCIGLTLLLCGSVSWAQTNPRSRTASVDEIAPFRLTGVEGYVMVNYLLDDTTVNRGASGAAAAVNSRQKQSNLREEVFLMTHSYVYHPSLLTLDIGGGPILDRGSYSSDGVGTTSDKEMYNLSARAKFLGNKPYRGGVFYEHLNPIQSVGPAQILLTETDQYGFDFSLLNPVTPVPVYLDATRTHTLGTSSEQTLDDRIDQFSLRSEGNIGTLGTTQARYQSIRQESRSGSLGLPIQASNSNSEIANMDTRLRFGAKREYDFTNIITFNTQKYATSQGAPTDVRDFRFGVDLRGQHSDALQTYARYGFNNNELIGQTSTMNSVGAGVTYQANPQLTTTLGYRGDFNNTTQFTSTLNGINGSALYRQALPVGEASVNYAFSYTQQDQKVSTAQAIVVGERLTLTGISPVALTRAQVIASTVVVSNLTRTQIFAAGVDYVLSVVGLTTRIARLASGSITDGQELLVDYTYDLGGTYALSQMDNSINLNWGLRNLLNVYLRLLDSSPTLTSGTPTFQLNPVRDTLFGTRADYPLPLLPELQVGGFIEWEDRREVVNPAKRKSDEAYVQMGLPIGRGTVRLGTRRTQVDYDLYPLQGVNLTAYDLRLWSRLPGGMDVFFDAGRESDTGTPTLRERMFATAKAQWRVRKFLMSFDLQRTEDIEGTYTRTRTAGKLLLRRDLN